MMSYLSYDGLKATSVAVALGGFAATQVGAMKSLYSAYPPCENDKALANFQELHGELKISGKVELLEKKQRVCSSGSQLFSCFKKVVVIDKSLAEIDPDATKWLMRRELTLLKNNSYVVLHGAALVSTIAALVLCPSPWNLPLGIASYTVVREVFETKIKRPGDKVAISEATESELLGALRLFHACSRAEHDFHRTKRNYKGGFFYKEASSQERFEMVKGSLKVRFRLSDEAIAVACADSRTEKLRKYIFSALNELNKG
jgi:hypothetical protein